MWTYQAFVSRVIDGDTVDLRVDLGFDIHHSLRVRLAGIDTAELRSKDPDERALAREAHVHLASLLPEGSKVQVQTEKDKREKFGRYLARIINRDGVDVGQYLLDQALAKPYTGGAR